MKIIVTGATGSLGRALITHFAGKGHEVVGIGRWQEAPVELVKIAEYRTVDIEKPFELPEADVCIHAAARSGDIGTDRDFYAPNITGTINAVNAASRCATFIHVSSSSVYLPEEDRISENMAGKQNNKLLSPYGRSKLLSEQALQETFKGHSCFVLRPRSLYGPGDLQIIPRMLRLVKKDRIYRPGEMKVNVSMTHYRNFAKAIECCISSNRSGINVYNVADEKEYILIDVIRQLTQAIYNRKLDEKQTPIWLIKLLARFNVAGVTPLIVRSITRNMVLDISRIKNELGYSTHEDFQSTLPELLQWIKNIDGPEVLRTEDRKLAWKG